MSKPYKEITVSLDYTFDYTHYVNNVAQTPVSPEATIYDNGGTTIANVTGVVTGEKMSFTFLAADNANIGRNFKIEMSFLISGEEIKINYLFDVVNVAIDNQVTDEDLFERLKDLRTMSRFSSSTTEVGTLTTIVDTSLARDRRNWMGGIGELLFNDETKANFNFSITAYDGVDTLTFIPAYSENVPSDTSYIARLSYQPQIDNAYETVMKRIRSRVGVAAGYIDNNSVNDLVIYRALMMICLAERETDGDKWDFRYKEFSQLYSETFTNFDNAYDKDQDGNISDEEQANTPNFFMIKGVR